MSRILIIEDDQIVANVYRNKFTVEGFQVEVARDGAVGLELAHSYRPDAVILDLILPKVPGLEVLKSLRANEDFKQTPIIVLSNTYLTNMVQDAWKAGATKCLSKANCDPKQVIQILHRVLQPPDRANGKAASTAPPPQVPWPASAGPATGAQAHASSETPEPVSQASLRRAFLARHPATLAALRVSLQGLIKADTERDRLSHIGELYERIRRLTGDAGICGSSLIAQMSDALEALLKELLEKPGNINPSTLRTVASAIDFLASLFHQRRLAETHARPQPEILVVDDDVISRRAINHALDQAGLAALTVEDPQRALALLSEKPFDLVILDVVMPGMTGYELCARLRTLPTNARTPVIFVTVLTDFESRANSTVSGGNDFIAKPFLFIELAVKALVYALRSHVAVKG